MEEKVLGLPYEIEWVKLELLMYYWLQTGMGFVHFKLGRLAEKKRKNREIEIWVMSFQTISEGQRVDRKKEEAHRLEVDLRRNKSLLVLCLGCQSKVKGL